MAIVLHGLSLVFCAIIDYTWGVMAFFESTDPPFMKGSGERAVSYLPLSHAGAQEADIYLSIYAAATVHFAQPDALKGSIAETLREVKPTIFYAVPR